MPLLPGCTEYLAGGYHPAMANPTRGFHTFIGSFLGNFQSHLFSLISHLLHIHLCPNNKSTKHVQSPNLQPSLLVSTNPAHWNYQTLLANSLPSFRNFTDSLMHWWKWLRLRKSLQDTQGPFNFMQRLTVMELHSQNGCEKGEVLPVQ